MIAIRPDTDAGRVLRLLVEYPGELRAEDVGRDQPLETSA